MPSRWTVVETVGAPVTERISTPAAADCSSNPHVHRRATVASPWGQAADEVRAKSAMVSVKSLPSGVIATSCLVSGMIAESAEAVSGL